MQFDGSSKLARAEPQCISLGPSPGAPFDDYGQTQSKKMLTQLPLQTLDLRASGFIPNIQ